MCMTMPDAGVGEPLSCGSLAVFPLFSGRSLFAEDENRLEYLLAHEAMARGSVVVTEVSNEGVVGDLLVRNDSETPVLMLDGSSLMGGKQSRVLNTTALLGGRSETRIPVSCIEVGRWGGTWGQFKSGSHCPPSLRRVIKEGSLSGGGQSSVWMEIRQKHRALGVSSPTGDLGAALESHREKVEQLKKQFPYPSPANGVAVVLCGKVIAVDILDKPATLEKVWDRLQEGMLLDFLEVPDVASQATGADVSAELYRIRNLPTWHEVKAVGLGREYRARDNGIFADALLHEGVMLHASAAMRFVR